MQFVDAARAGYDAYAPSYGYKGQRYRAGYVSAVRLASGPVTHRLTLAFDAERERFRTADPTGFAFNGWRGTGNLGLTGQYDLAWGDRVGAGVSVRHDWNDRFADATTYRAQASVRAAARTRLRGAAGSGIKNPGFFDLYGYQTGRYTGNPNLRPVRSEGWEAGVEQRVGAVTLAATYFNNVLTDRIAFAPMPPTGIFAPYNTRGRERQRGVELAVDGRLGGGFRLDASYTYLRARQAGLEALRRPPHSGSVNLAWRAPDNRGGATLTVRYTGASRDVAFTDPNSFAGVNVGLKAYTIVALAGDVRIAGPFAAFARVENLTNERYEQLFGFRSPGVAAYGGVRARF